jgi:hypothetical protein
MQIGTDKDEAKRLMEGWMEHAAHMRNAESHVTLQLETQVKGSLRTLKHS